MASHYLPDVEAAVTRQRMLQCSKGSEEEHRKQVDVDANSAAFKNTNCFANVLREKEKHSTHSQELDETPGVTFNVNRTFVCWGEHSSGHL